MAVKSAQRGTPVEPRDKDGEPIGGARADLVNGKTGDITTTADTAIIAAQGAGVAVDLDYILVQNSHATVATWVNIKDGTTVKATAYAKAGGGGVTIPLPKPIPGTANTAWNAACETAGANVRVNAVGHKVTV